MTNDSSPAVLSEARWIIGVNALLRKDTASFRHQLQVLDAMSSAESRIARRSLRAVATGLSGNSRIAAESLLALEREHGDYQTKVWSAMSADRLLGAIWLTDHGRLAPADSLLRFVQGLSMIEQSQASHPVVSLAYLQRARIAQKPGNNNDAVLFAKIFLLLFDRGPASQQALIEEARVIIDRLSDGESRRPK
jgi:hypothetical protein